MREKLESVHRLGTGVQGAQFRCGIVRNAAGYFERRFVTPQYAVVYVIAGRGRYADHTGRSFELASGDLYQRFPSRVHDVTWLTACERAYLAVPCQCFELLELAGVMDTSRPVLHVGGGSAWSGAFDQLRTAMQDCADDALGTLLPVCLAFLLKLLGSAGGRSPSDPIRRAAQLLSQDLAGRQRLPQIARAVGLGYAAFRKRFTQEQGLSPREYRIRRRLERAMALLTGERLRMKEIAARLGFADEYAFSAQFRKYAGMPPTVFRRSHG